MPRKSQRDHIEELESLIYLLAKVLLDSKILLRSREEEIEKIIETIPASARIRAGGHHDRNG